MTVQAVDAGGTEFPPDWVDGGQETVTIIGAGQSGVAIAYHLRRAGIARVGVIDAAPPEGVGVWQTIGRMRTLRTERDLPGFELGNPELGFRHWYVLRHGAAAHAALGRIPRLVWQDYLDWFRQQTGVQPRYNTRLLDVAPDPDSDGLVLTLGTAAGRLRHRTRRLVLATGVDGLGGANVPAAIAARIPATHRLHTADGIDYTRFAGQRVAVIGSATSGFDAAASALEAGAQEVHHLCRHQTLAVHPPLTGALYPPEKAFVIDYPDALRWQMVATARARGTLPVQSVQRAQALPGYHLHMGRDVTALRIGPAGLLLETATGPLPIDRLITATGYVTDLGLRPELAALAPHVLLWRDRIARPPAEQAHWGLYPYLGPGFEFLPRDPAAAWVSRVHVYNYAAIVSHGIHIGDVGSSVIGMPRLVTALGQGLFDADREQHFSRARDALRRRFGTESAPVAAPVAVAP